MIIVHLNKFLGANITEGSRSYLQDGLNSSAQCRCLTMTHYYLIGKLKENLAPLPSELFSHQILPP